MALRFILGSSGAGKSRLLFETALRQAGEHPDRRYIILVPEQFTMQTQKELVKLSPVHGILNIDVLSFTRLAYRVFEETGVKKRTVLTETGKSLLLRLIAAREASGLSLLSGVLDRPGCLDELKSILSELDQYGIGEKELEQILEKIEKPEGHGGSGSRPALAGKLREILALQKAFLRYQEDRFITAQMLPQLLCEKAPSSRLLKGCGIFLDGYTGFTPAQLDVLTTLFPLAGDITVTVTLPAGELNLWKRGSWRETAERAAADHDLFALSKRTIQALIRSAYDAGTEVDEEPLLPDGRYGRLKKGSELEYLEKHLLRMGKRAAFAGAYTGQISLRPCADPAEEVLAAAAAIDTLTKRHGLHYRDIAVVCGSLPAYSEYARRIFSRYEIPFFIDQSVNVVLNPAFEFVSAACAALDSNFSYESMMRLFRTGFIFSGPQETDFLENYLLAAGIRGRRAWMEPWTRQTRTMDAEKTAEAERLRAEFMEKFGPFAEEMRRGKNTVRAYSKALWEMLTLFKIPGKLAVLKEKAQERGEQDRAREYDQVTGVIASVLDEAVSLTGGESVTRRQFEKILEAGFSEARIGIIPPGIDEVHVGDLERSRLNHVSVIFFLGLNDEYIPRRRTQGGILTDMEREFLKMSGVRLAPTAKEQANIQEFYLYLMLTKPEKMLVLSWSAVGSDGRQMRPSYLAGQIRELFPEAEILPGPGRDPYRLVTSPRTGLPVLASELAAVGRGEGKELPARIASVRELMKLYLPDGPYADRALTMIRMAAPQAEEAILGEREREKQKTALSRDLAAGLYGEVLEGSVTRLETFAGCACAHFLSYGLRLEEREEYEVRAADVGSILHRAAEIFCRRVSASEEYGWRDLPDEVREKWAGEALREVIESTSSGIFSSTARYGALTGRLDQILKRSVWAMQKQISAGLFEPSSFEIGFDSLKDLAAVSIDLGEGRKMRLHGRIDRIDLSEDREHRVLYVKVTDYKTGMKKFDLNEFWAGEQMQLIVYMDAASQMEELARRGEKIVCAGIFYYQMKDPVLKWDPYADPDEDRLEDMKVDGLVNDDPEVLGRLDRNLQGKSRVIPVTLNKDGQPNSYSRTVNSEQMELLRARSRRKMAELGKSVFEGEISPSPLRDGTRTACDYCLYRDVCRFDPSRENMGYRDLKHWEKGALWQAMRLSIQENGET